MSESETKPVNGAPKIEGTELERYYEVMRAHDLTELEVREGTLYIKLSRATPPVHIQNQPAGIVPSAVSPVPAAPKNNTHAITSPLAGIFYRSPAPSSPSFVKEGDKVAFGDVVCIVEAMKVMNEIRSDRPGVIHKILAENGKPVSAGQDLFQLDPL